MTRSHENRCFRRFQQTRDPKFLGKVFDATGAELLRVAGHLANGNVELTQDALQATFLTAIERADSYDANRDVRPWLLGILANHVRKERRRAGAGRNAAAGEAGVAAEPPAESLVESLAGDPALDSPVEIAHGREFGNAAKQAMRQLPSPFREVLVLHLQHGLNAKEIGEALGRPAGTVRTQVVRGMDRLRALLPAGFTAAALGMVLTPGPILAAVRSKVLASLPPIAAGSSSLLLTGWRLYAMIAAGLTVVLSMFLPLLATEAPEPPPGVVAPSQDGVADLVQTPAERNLVAEGAAPEPVQQARPKKARVRDPKLQRVTLKVVYEDGKPAENVPILCRLDGVHRRWMTGERGRLELFLPWPGFHNLFVVGTRKQHHMSWFDGLSRPKVSRERIVIPNGVTLDVRVVDGSGNPVADATVDSSHGGGYGGSVLSVLGKTDADGRFVRQHVGARGQLRVWGDGFQPTRIVDANGEVGDTITRTMTLSKPGHACSGIVRDEQGRPLAGAQLALVSLSPRPSQPQHFESADDGSFALTTLPAGQQVIVGIHRDKDLRRGLVRFAHGGVEKAQVELRMTPGARVVGKLLVDGKPMSGTNVVARDRPEAISRLPFLETWTKTQPDGSFALEALLPGTYSLESDGFVSQVVTVGEGETLSWNPVRKALLPISIRLLDAQGRPLEGWQVSAIDPGTSWPSGGTVTGADGRFHEYSRPWEYPAGSFCRFALHQRQGLSDEAWSDFSRLPNMVTPPLQVGMEHEVRVPATAISLHTLVGRVVDAKQLPVAGVEIELRSGYGSVWFDRARLDADGAFRCEGLPPGRHRLVVKRKGKPTYVSPPFEVRKRRDHDLGRIVIPASGRIRVSLPSAAPATGVKMKVSASGGRTYRLRKQKDGTFLSPLVFHGTYELQGWTGQTWAAPQAITLAGDEAKAELVLVPHRATRIAVELSPDYPRNSSGWSGTLIARRSGKRVFELRLARSFVGQFLTSMQFDVPLPPGPLELELASWGKWKGKAQVRVPATGGGQATIYIE